MAQRVDGIQAVSIVTPNNTHSRLRCPDIDAGAEGVRWVENRVRSAEQGGVWVDRA